MEIITEKPEWFIKALTVKHKSDFVKVSGADIHYMEWGDKTNPSVIMLHGNHAHAYWFQFIGALLSDKYHFVVMSFSGMGDSDWRSFYTRDTFVEDVLGVLEAIPLQKPVVIGHSFGGLVALLTASYYSSKMSGLLLVDYIVNPPEKHIEWYKDWPQSKPPKIRNSKEEKKTIIFSSHRMEEVQSLADNIGVIYNGKLIFSGSKTDFESKIDSVSYDDTLIQLINNA